MEQAGQFVGKGLARISLWDLKIILLPVHSLIIGGVQHLCEVCMIQGPPTEYRVSRALKRGKVTESWGIVIENCAKVCGGR